MPFIPVPNVIEAQFIYDINGAQCRNVMHFRGDNTQFPYDQTALNDYGASLTLAYVLRVMPHLAASCVFSGLELRDLTAQNLPGSSRSHNHPGGQAGGSLPPGSAAVLSLKTSIRGRSYRGRIYLPGLDENDVANNGEIEAQAHTDLQAGFRDFWTDMAGNPPETRLHLVVASKYSGVDVVPGKKVPIPRAQGIATTVESITLRQYVKSQRRRNLKG